MNEEPKLVLVKAHYRVIKPRPKILRTIKRKTRTPVQRKNSSSTSIRSLPDYTTVDLDNEHPTRA